MLKQLQLLIKPVSGACNIDCRYCFYKKEMKQRMSGDRGKMCRDTMTALIDKALLAAETCLFGFQGGEPLLAGLEFFQEFIDYVEERRSAGQKVHYTVQTNGTLLDEAWGAFFRKHQFLVGLSLDGVRKSHDANRIGYQGEGTFPEVFRAAELLKRENIEFQVLCVLNSQTASRIEAIYRFFLKKELYSQQYIPCLERWEEDENRRPYHLEPEELGQAWKKLFDLWFQDKLRGVPVYIRQFDNYLEVLRGGSPEACTMYGRCSMQNVIEADGTVYPCDFYAEDQYRLGNIKDSGTDFLMFASLEEGNTDHPFFQEMSRRDDRCGACRWYPICRGGCKIDCRQIAGSQVNQYCEVYQDFFCYTIERLEYLASLDVRPLRH